MTNLVRDSLAVRNARATARLNLIDADTNPGKILCYTAPVPTTGAAITTQTLLATLTLSKPSGTVTNGVLTLSTVTGDTSADADGTIAFVRVVDGANAFICDLDATATGGGGAITFNSLVTITGVGVSVTSGTITEP